MNRDLKHDIQRVILKRHCFFCACALFLNSPFEAFAETDPLLDGLAPTPSAQVEVTKVESTPAPTQAQAQTSTPVPTPTSVKLPPEAKPVHLPIATPIAEAASESMPLTGAADENTTSLSIKFGPSFNSHRLSAQGLTSSVPFGVGSYAGIVFLRESSSGCGYRVSFDQTRNDHKNFTSVTPSTVRIEHTRAEASLRLSIQNSWSANLGYGYFSRKSTQTSPSAVVGEYQAHGLVLGIENFDSRSSSVGHFRFGSGLVIRLPVYFYENNSATGSHVGSTEAELRSGLNYRVSKKIDLGVQVQFRGSMHRYRGAGSRGTTDAFERDFTFHVPFEVRLYF